MSKIEAIVKSDNKIEISTNLKSKSKSIKSLEKHKTLIMFNFSFVLTILLTLSTIWYLSVISGVIFGYVYHKRTLKTFFMGALSVSSAWTCFITYWCFKENALKFMDMLMHYITGSEGLGWITILLSLAVGGIIGGLGSVIGYSIYNLKTPAIETN